MAVQPAVSPLRLYDRLAMKLVLNNVSTATMACLGRLVSNWMAHVEPTNKKLIDRGTRLVGEIGGLSQFKNSMRIYWGGNFLCMIMCALFMWLLISRVGNEFFTSANYLIFSGAAAELPVRIICGMEQREDGLGFKDLFQCIHPDDRERLSLLVDELIDKRISFETDHRIVLPDGAERVVLHHLNVIDHDNERTRGIAGTVQDITARKQAASARG